MLKDTEANPTIPVDVIELTISLENDQYGHVNYKDYPKLFEAGQDAYMSARNMTFEGLEEEYGLKSVVPNYTVNVRSESFSGDEVRIETRIDRIGNTSFTFGQSMKKGETLIADFSLVVVLIDSEGKPTSIPETIRGNLHTQTS